MNKYFQENVRGNFGHRKVPLPTYFYPSVALQNAKLVVESDQAERLKAMRKSGESEFDIEVYVLMEALECEQTFECVDHHIREAIRYVKILCE
jgi:hypothetical protein